MKLTYEKNGDYLIPNLKPNEEPEGTHEVRTDEKELLAGNTGKGCIRVCSDGRSERTLP